MMTWCPNEIKTHLNCCLLYGFEVVKVRLNIFGHFWQHSEAFGKSSEIFGSRWDIAMTRQKSHTFCVTV